MEKEEDVAIPFLDMLVMKEGTSLNMTVYNKPTYILSPTTFHT
jgi:hypothetical protein